MFSIIEVNVLNLRNRPEEKTGQLLKEERTGQLLNRAPTDRFGRSVGFWSGI